MSEPFKFKVKPSIFSSGIIFVLHGSKLWHSYQFRYEKYAEVLVMIVITSSAFFYYFLSITSEYLFPPDDTTGWRKAADWCIQIFQYVAFFLLWDFVVRPDLSTYAALILALNVSYLIWDFIHMKQVQKFISLLWIDAIGVCLSIWLFFVIPHFSSTRKSIASDEDILYILNLGALSMLTIFQVIVGIILTSIHIYKKYRRPSIPKKEDELIINQQTTPV